MPPTQTDQNNPFAVPNPSGSPTGDLATGGVITPQPSPAPAAEPPTSSTRPADQAPPRPIEVPQPSQPKKGKGASTQDLLKIAEIRDGLAVMRDGSLRAVVLCKSINFDLMSPQERTAVEFSYQGFINSLYFPVQIFIRSQRVDLAAYLDKLQKIHNDQENILLRLMMEDYIGYVRYLIEAANVMAKQFYIVVPYYPPLLAEDGKVSGSFRRIGGILGSKKGPVVISETDFARHKAELAQRVQVVLSGLHQLGIQAIPLNTQELIELYYIVYNPQSSTSQRLTSAEELEAPLVTKASGEPPATERPQ